MQITFPVYLAYLKIVFVCIFLTPLVAVHEIFQYSILFRKISLTVILYVFLVFMCWVVHSQLKELKPIQYNKVQLGESSLKSVNIWIHTLLQLKSVSGTYFNALIL